MAPYTFYTWGTPNGWKPSILLEELGVEYETKGVNIMSNTQKEDWFTAINPNGRIPALVDHTAGDQRVFESGAILWYLAEKEDKEGKFWPKDFGKRAEVMSWLMFQMGGVGPMQGQANHFVRFSSEKIAYGMNRYVEETKRLYGVMDQQLAKTEYLAGEQYTIADIAVFPWVALANITGVDYKTYPNLAKWFAKIYARPAVKKGLAVPAASPFLAGLDDEEQYKKAIEAANETIAKANADAKN
jgi:glutathione S-transferase